MDSIERGELARTLFIEGYNCAQAVVCAFDDVTGLDRDTAARMASSFGGGLSRLREVCGTVSGAALVLGLTKGYSDPKDPAAKRDHYHRVQAFARRFQAENGSIICRELLRGVDTRPGLEPEARTEAYYAKRPCPALAACAARILNDMLTIDNIDSDSQN